MAISTGMSVPLGVAPIREHTDQVLLDGVRRGDQPSFEVLFDRHYGAVHQVVYRITGDRRDAEEIALDTFMKLYERPIPVNDDTNVRGWLFRVATNAAFNAVRSRKRRQSWIQRAAQRIGIGDMQTETPERAVLQRDEALRVRAVLDELPERQRTALALRATGMSYREIAETLGVNSTSIGTMLARAEDSFARRWSAAGYGDEMAPTQVLEGEAHGKERD